MDPTVTELLEAFWTYAHGHYVDSDVKPTSELVIYKRLLKSLKALFGRTPIWVEAVGRHYYSIPLAHFALQSPKEPTSEPLPPDSNVDGTQSNKPRKRQRTVVVDDPAYKPC